MSLRLLTFCIGKLSDIFGRRREFQALRPLNEVPKRLYFRIAAILFAVISFLLGSLGCASAPNMIIFLASRCVAGIGAGGLTGIAFIIVADLFPLSM